MYKLAVIFALVGCALAAPKPGYLHAEPLVAVAHSVPVATSYANTYKVSVKSPLIAAHPVAYAAAPVVHAAPLAVAPVHVAHHASSVVHTAPIAYAAHAW